METYGLEVNQKIKFQRAVGGRFTNATVHSFGEDGSVCVVDEGKGHLRSVMPSRIQVEGKTPRGKTVWVLLLESTN